MKDYSFKLVIVTTVLVCQFVANRSFNPQSKQEIKYGKASLTLYQGKFRHEILGSNCPVGVAFQRPERFSCACVNGVWAFYDVMCAPPLAVIGGNNYCFQMPDSYIQQVAVVSNPLRPLEDTLTVFEGEKESIRSKVYRNLHSPLNQTDNFLAINSSWTLKESEADDGVCLQSQYITTVRDPTFMRSMFCNFANISNIIPNVRVIMKGCHPSSVKIDPVDCQPLLAPNSESICTSMAVLHAFSLAEQDSNDADSTNRSTRAFQRRWKHTTTAPTTRRTMLRKATKRPKEITGNTTPKTSAFRIAAKPPISKAPIVDFLFKPNIYVDDQNDNSVDRIGRKTKEFPKIPSQTDPSIQPTQAHKQPIVYINKSTKSTLSAVEELTQVNATSESSIGKNEDNKSNDDNSTMTRPDMIEKMVNLWENREDFLVPPFVESEAEVMDQLWQYEKITIQKSLGLHSTTVTNTTSQIVQMLEISRDIMEKICPLVSGEYLNLALDTFLAVQRKNYHWKEPFIAVNDFLRIYTALTACKDRASSFDFVYNGNCIAKNPGSVNIDSNRTTIKDKIPNEFVSAGFEPIVESIWKVVVSTHSYCFEDFLDYYNDHHKYTVALYPAFENGINKLWFNHRNKNVAHEYAGVIGLAEEILNDIDKCTAATRLVSKYPFHLSRPSLDVSEYAELGANDQKADEKSRKKRAVDKRHSKRPQSQRTVKAKHSKPVSRGRRFISRANTRYNPIKIPNPKESSNGVPPQEKVQQWKESRSTLQGMGYCLKKYDEPRLYLEQNCDL